MTDPAIRILLADDHQVLRQGLKALLEGEDDMRVIAEAGTGEAAVRLALAIRPDVVVMDLGMPEGNGLEATREIRRQLPGVRIVVLTMHSGREPVMQALQAGADGYVPKSAAHTNLLQAIRVVHAGQRFLDPSAATVVVDELMDDRKEARQLAVLSDREREILRMTAMGYTSRETGERTGLSPKTVETYRQRAMEKLDLRHRSDIVRFALRAGLLDEAQDS